MITELIVMLRRFVVDCSSIVPKYGSIFPGMVANLLPPFRQSKRFFNARLTGLISVSELKNN
ncbi:hypothetical protein Asd1617_02986 [Shigella dysenteriae 1617]|uniref:Uncharacterized protein n=1 Tax=Shigella dysenteriae 1617 TaxID=754093 RepID=A0A0A6ZUL9_SHIDY|nr:hypothetical protein Asd1617_02986 [Shigella dysenteriae 1617]